MTAIEAAINRRVVSAALAWLGLALGGARAQGTGKVWRIGYLGPSPETAPQLVEAFREGLAAFGYVDRRNAVVEYRWTNAGTKMNDEAVLLAHARELVALGVDVLVASIDPAIRAARQASSTVPIVMLNVSDPVELGLVESLRHPGGNVTGMTRLSPELIGKNMQLLRELVPKASRFGLLVSASNPMSRSIVGHARQAAQAQSVALQLVELRSPDDLVGAFADLKAKGVDALLVADTGGGVFFTQRAQLAGLALTQRLPAIYANTEIVEAGGLMSYSASAVAHYRRAAAFVDKILRGAKAGDIPVEQPAKFEFVINLRTAKALNLAVPQALLLRADRLIE